MRIAVVGSGIAGLGSAWLLGSRHEVTLFEAQDHLGGHTDTHAVEIASQPQAVDTGFIVHNPRHYPRFTRLLTELGVPIQDTQMTFSVRNEGSGLAYSTTSLDALFRQRRNLVSPRFYRMLGDIARFYRRSPALLSSSDTRLTLGDYLEAGGYSAAFRDEHIVPMCAALWSAPAAGVLGYPARFLVEFMANHEMLTLGARSSWKVVQGGSQSYIRALEARWRVNVRLSCPVRAVRRTPAGVQIVSGAGTEHFDQIVLACHSDQALALLQDPSDSERAVLGAIPYQKNETVLHTDASFLPARRGDWAAWNAFVPAEATSHATVSYCMNVLQGIRSPEAIVVTLNATRPIAPDRILKTLHYAHPQFTPEAVAAQARRGEIQGRQGTWFAGAYWGFGFHEDGLRSAVEVSQALGVNTGIATDEVPAGEGAGHLADQPA